jgi:hypothetical protein
VAAFKTLGVALAGRARDRDNYRSVALWCWSIGCPLSVFGTVIIYGNVAREGLKIANRPYTQWMCFSAVTMKWGRVLT